MHVGDDVGWVVSFCLYYKSAYMTLQRGMQRS